VTTPVDATVNERLLVDSDRQSSRLVVTYLSLCPNAFRYGC